MNDRWSSVYQSQLERYQTVFSSDHNMDTKGGVVLSAILVVSVFAINKNIFQITNKYIFALLIIGCLLYLAALVILIFGLYPRRYPLPANSTKDHPEYLEMEYETLMYQLVVDTEDATSMIEENLKRKAVLFSLATVLFVIGTLSLLVVKLING